MRAWLFEQLRAEPAGVVKERAWSYVLRARGSDGVLYFKAAARPGRHEAGLLAALAPRWPDLLPQPLAALRPQVEAQCCALAARRRERLRDAYLEPWTSLAPHGELVEHYERALWLSLLGRALDFQWMLAGSGAAGADWRGHIDHWLRRLLAAPEPGAPATMRGADA